METQTQTNKGWRSKLSNSVLILYTSKKDKRASSSSTTTTCTETNKTTTSTNRTDVSSLSQSLPVRATRTDTPLSLSAACDCDCDDNQSTTEQSNTEVDGEKEKRYGDHSHSSRNVLENSARDMFEYGRQMKWLTASMTQRLRKSESSDNNGSKKPGADESEFQAKCEGAKKEYVSQGSLEYNEDDSEMEKETNTTPTQTAIESVTTQKKSHAVRPSALEYGRQMGWVS